jgi:UDP-N-acetylglucosamine 2-epimerase
MKVLSVFGTRPEAIKMAPVVHELRNRAQIESRVCVTGQHREMLDQVLRLFEIEPDFDLNIMQENQRLAGTTARVLEHIDPVLQAERPDWVLVQGDTTTALAAFYWHIPVGHVEPGTVKMVGTEPERIMSETERLLNDRVEYERMALAMNPYGDGHASERIVQFLLGEPVLEFAGEWFFPAGRLQVCEGEVQRGR